MMCTTIGFSYKAGVVFGRTLEVGVPLDNKVGYVPKNTPDFIPNRNGSFPPSMRTLGTMFFSVASFGDGLNEHGLMGSNNLSPGYASFAKEDKADKINLTTSRAFDYLLTRCATVKEVQSRGRQAVHH
ncbi:MAG: linear amide C-N hydrolase [Alkalibacterium sp.]|nr:linear amide C-N hydrolase [Alkalibacterium sp.]